MAGLDFRRGADLFLATEKELATALGLKPEQLRAYRSDPDRAPADVLARLGAVLVERGRAMQRVGEMLGEAE